MKIHTPLSKRFRAATCLLAIGSPALLNAQSGGSGVEDSDVFELSPFLVSSDSEEGYRATQTVSGSRLATDLKNVGASIDVLTQEFLDDMMAVDMYDALDFVGNVSTWSKSGADTSESNQEWWGVPYYARGFLSNTVLTDFFARVEYSSDSYSTERLTVSRGPNAVLYGIGQPGGVVNVSRKRPILGNDLNHVKLSANSEGGFRAQFDVSRSLLDDTLGVRFAAVSGDKGSFRAGGLDERDGLYGAVTYKPFEGSTLTATFEDASNKRAIGGNHVFYDAVTPWLEAGSPIYDAQSADPVPDGIRKTGVRGGSPTYIQGRPDLGVLDWSDAYIGNYNSTSKDTPFNDETAIFDLTNLVSGGDSNVDSDYKDFALFFEQKLADGMFLELAYNKVQIENQVNRLTRVHDYISVDANKYMPDGTTPNPYVGVPFLDVQRSETHVSERRYNNFRATYSWAIDLREQNLGKYNIVGMLEQVDEDYAWGLYRQHNSEPFPGANSRLNHASNRVRQRVYLDSTITPSGLEVFDYFQWNEDELESALPAAEWGPINTRRNFGERESYVVALQGDLFPSEKGFDYLSFTYGLRHDDDSTWGASGGAYSRDANNYYVGQVYDRQPSISSPGVFDVANNYNTVSDPVGINDYTNTYTLMGRPTSKLTFVYNYSDVLIAGAPTQIDINFNRTPETVGETTDFGVRFELLDSQLYGTLTYFDTVAGNQAINDFHVDNSGVIRAIYEVVDPTSPYYDNLGEWYFLRDDKTTGMEFGLTGSVGNTTGRLSISQQNTVIDQQVPILTQWVEDNRAAWSASSDEALLTQAEGLTTVGEAIDYIVTEVGNYNAAEGSTPDTQREWKVSFTATHRFAEGFLERWSLGGSLFWESADTIGYITDPNTGLDDTSRGFDGDELFRLDTFVSYKTKLFQDTDMTLRLHVRNLLNEDGYFGREAIDVGGMPYLTRTQLHIPRSVSVSADFKF